MPSPSASVTRPWRPALALVLAVTVARLVYLRWLCPYALVEDEAYYWLWSRHLDWSYLTKGPGIAMTIALGTLIGGDTEFGVRLTAPLWGAVLALGVSGLAGELARPSEGCNARGSAQACERRGASTSQSVSVPKHGHAAQLAHARFWGAAIVLLSPPMQAVALFMTIDGPMLACWAVAMWLGVRAARAPRNTGVQPPTGVGVHANSHAVIGPTPDPGRGLHPRRAGGAAWIGAGLAIGVGVLFKPTIAIIAPVLLLALRMRTGLSSARVALGLFLTAAGFVPIIAWNAAHGWPMAEHLGDHLSAPDSASLLRRAGWIAEHLGLQSLLAGIALGAAIMGALASTNGPELAADRRGVFVCLACSGAVYGFYTAIACFTRVEGNWPLGGLIPLLGIAGAWLATAEGQRKRRHLARAAIIVGLITGLGMLRLDLVAQVPGVGAAAPIGRLTAGPALAEGARDLLAANPRLTRQPPLIVTDHYGRAALLEFYLNKSATDQTGPPVHITCASHALGGPPTQFDLWPEHRLANPALVGRPALLFGGRAERWDALFGRIEPLEPIPGDHKQRGVFIGWAYRAHPPAAAEGDEGDR